VYADIVDAESSVRGVEVMKVTHGREREGGDVGISAWSYGRLKCVYNARKCK
jgi:hypothetical protein